MKIDGVLSKLEKRARVTLRCDWCRYALRDTSLTKQKRYAADPHSHIKVSCPYCGTEFTVDVSSCDEHEREATILYHNHGTGLMYRNERVYAATQWLIQKRLLKRWRAGDLNKEKIAARSKAKVPHHSQQRYQKKNEDRYMREQAEIKERAHNFIQRMYEKEEQEYGPHSFPLAADVEGIEKPDTSGWFPSLNQKISFEELIARKVLYATRVMEVCERTLWGKVLLETRLASEQLAAMVQNFEEERAQLLREKEADEERKAAEREAERQARMREHQQFQSPYDRWR